MEAKLDQRLLKLRNQDSISRADIASLLKFIGGPKQQRRLKIEAITKLNLRNSQDIGLEKDLSDYPEF